MLTVLMGLAASTSWGLGDYSSGIATRHHNLLSVFVVTRLVGVVALLMFMVLAGQRWLGDSWWVAAASGCLMGLGAMATLRALAIGPMSVTAPMLSCATIIPALWGFITGTSIGLLVLVGLAIAFIGGVIAASMPGRDGTRVSGRAVMLCFVSAVLMGSGLVLLYLSSEGAAVSAVMVERCAELTVGLVALRFTASHRPFPGRILGLASFSGMASASANVFYAVAAGIGPLPVAAVTSSLAPVMTATLARCFSHERLGRRQAVGAAGVVIGVALISFGISTDS
jgi:drug/metabolite transporter (DMT)-like permease